MFQLKHIILFILIVVGLFSCNYTNTIKNRKTASFKNIAIELKSAIFNKNTQVLNYSFTIKNNSANKVYFPIMKNHPLFSMRGIGGPEHYFPDTIFTNATYIKIFDKEKKEINLSKMRIIGGMLFFEDSLSDREKLETFIEEEDKELLNSLLYKYEVKELLQEMYLSKSSWEVKNYLLTLKHKKNKTPVKNGYYWAITYDVTKKEAFSIKENEEIDFKLERNIESEERNNIHAQNYNIYKKIHNAKYIQLYIFCDSTSIKEKLLLPKDIDSLRNSNTKIFHGLIESNIIPLQTLE